MSRIKSSKPKKEVEKKHCTKCQEYKTLKIDFYMSYSPLHSDGRIPICKGCLLGIVGESYEKVLDILRMIDKPWISSLWESALESGKEPFGEYMKNLALNYKNKTWADSELTEGIASELTPKGRKGNVDTKNGLVIENTTGYALEDLKEKYGYGYPDDEYYLFEKKYQQLKPSFQLLTTMHEEYFKEYCINKVKETLAKAKGDFKEAKEWAAMVKDVAEAGKLKPSQMSKADLSGGLDTFGQLARMVEENCEIMPLFPKFIEQPKDKVDVTLWCFVNYVRDIKGLPECEYKDIYAFYEQRRRDYEENLLDNHLGISTETEADIDG